MANRTTRNKIRLQAQNAMNCLVKAQSHMTQLAALADERSDIINDTLPSILAATEIVVKTFERFSRFL